MISRNRSVSISHRAHLTFLLVIIITSNLVAQKPTLFELKLNKDNISWVWEGNLYLSTRTWRQSQFQIDNHFSSNLHKEIEQEDKWTDENNFLLSWLYPLSATVQFRTLLDSKIFSDEISNTKFNKHIAAEEIDFQPHPKINLTPALGWTVEEIFERQDQGWYSKMGLEINKLDMGGYLNSTDLNSTIRDFPGRKNQEHSFFTSWSRQFSDIASDSFRIGYQFSDKKYYLAQNSQTQQSSDNLETVTINARFFNNQLTYLTGNNSRLSIISEFKNRSINQDNPFLETPNRRKEIYFSNQFNYLFTWGPLGTNSGMMFSQTINDNPGTQTDIDNLQAALTSEFRLQLSKRDVLSGRFSYTKYEYSTPREGNRVDDRDEQRFIIDSGYRHRFSPFFELKLNGQVYLYHQIFLSAQRSANNNWNRIYQLSSGFDYQLGNNLQHRHQLKILANYTAFDFDEILPQIRSYVFRKLIYTDSLTIKLTESLYLNTFYQWENEDNGTFFKDEFSQQVTKEIKAHFLNIALQHQHILGFQLTTGIAFYWRDEWTFIPDKKKVRELRSIAPRMTIIYPASTKLILYATYAPNRSTNFGKDIEYFTTGRLNLQYFF
jgi:hypothetical protein